MPIFHSVHDRPAPGKQAARRVIILGVIPALAGALTGYGIGQEDITVTVGALSLLGWHLYLVCTETA